jgi:hypothetical protein
MIFILIVSWAMIINTAKLLRDRMLMQNAADNAAISLSVHKARALNTLGLLNYAIASALYGPETGPFAGYLSYYQYGVTFSFTGSPAKPKIPLPDLFSLSKMPLPCYPMGGIPPGSDGPGYKAVDDQRTVAAYLDIARGDGTSHIKDIRLLVDRLAGVQDYIAAPFKSNAPMQLLARAIGRRQERDSSGDFTGADAVVVSRGIALGLRRNANGVGYHRSQKSDGIGMTVTKGAINAFLIMVLGSPVTIDEIYEAVPFNTGKRSWLYADRAEFDRSQKIVVHAAKFPGSGSNRGYPIFGSWLDLSWPAIETAAAAGLYNTGGPMFPLEDGGRPSDRISPVLREYRKAKYHGWDAHLVPLGGVYRH